MADRLLKSVRDSATPSLQNGRVQYASTGLSETSGNSSAAIARVDENSIVAKACADVTIGENTTHYRAVIDLSEIIRVENQLAAVRNPDGTIKFTAEQVKARSADLRRALAAAILATIPA